jgi:hypothetical protein
MTTNAPIGTAPCRRCHYWPGQAARRHLVTVSDGQSSLSNDGQTIKSPVTDLRNRALNWDFWWSTLGLNQGPLPCQGLVTAQPL